MSGDSRYRTRRPRVKISKAKDKKRRSRESSTKTTTLEKSIVIDFISILNDVYMENNLRNLQNDKEEHETID